ncbi:MAG TPA: UDP-N-acetylglucosamine 2-epimerase [Chitinophagaceae bacterium]|nr:UDP-N-acetylglucosamine 2-epimerase [Chitinophagaceae bacterium]
MATRILVVTGTRAEYGLLRPLLRLLESNASFDLRLVVTGAHLSGTFGLTYREILRDGFSIAARVPIETGRDRPADIAASSARALEGMARVFSRMKPDWVLLLGDRYETLSTAIAAHLCAIPIAHISGGEVSAGATDDAFRHAITKMSLLHFTATEDYRRRVIQLGESPSRVFRVGALGIDNIRSLSPMTREELEKDLGISLRDPFLLVTFHPVTLDADKPSSQFRILLMALEQLFPMKMVMTYPNADAGGKSIIRMIESFSARHRGMVAASPSLGQHRYLSLMRIAGAVVGNSSSGIVEAPSLKVPTVDIGNRQSGRSAAASVIRCRLEQKAILRSVRKALSGDFATFIRGVKNPYGNGETAPKILKILERFASQKNIQKGFFDLDHE